MEQDSGNKHENDHVDIALLTGELPIRHPYITVFICTSTN